MADKLWVKETEEEDEEGNPLTVIQVYDSKPKDFSYLVFLNK